MEIELLPNYMLVEAETKYGAGELDGIVMLDRFKAAPMETCTVLDAKCDDKTASILGMRAEDLIGKRVYCGAGGRPVPDGENKFIYPLLICENPRAPRKKQRWTPTILGIVEDEVEVNALGVADKRCKFCGDARPGERRGRAMMLQPRTIDGYKTNWCPRCHKTEEGDVHPPG
jgi:hypothetical protein